MPAVHHLQPRQWARPQQEFTQDAMIMDPKDLMTWHSGDTPYSPGTEGYQAMWNEKLHESKSEPSEPYVAGKRDSWPHGSGVYEAMREGKVDALVNLYHGDRDKVTNGHHRIAAAADLGRLVPVRHSYDFPEPVWPDK